MTYSTVQLYMQSIFLTPDQEYAAVTGCCVLIGGCLSQPSINTDDAVDFLSGGFTEPTAAPVVKAPVPPSQVITYNNFH